MYLKHFGFEKSPFNITPNPDFLFLSATHKEVFAHLLYGIRKHSGFIAVTGEVGTGKTTVLRTLFKQLEEDAYRLALIFNPRLDAVELLQSINREFGIDHASTSLAELQTRLNEFLLAENGAGRTVVLVVDEAQNLSAEVLEQIRLLSNLETETDKLIQIVLVGQPELEVMLQREELRQLRQRITVSYRLESMSDEDGLRYIHHRMSVAGQPRLDIFSPAALKQILRRSRGNPRLINILCDRCLLVSFSENASQVSARHVRQARRELWREEGGRLRFARRLLAVLLLVFLGTASGYWVSNWHVTIPLGQQEKAPAKTQLSAQAVGPEPVAPAEEPASPGTAGEDERSQDEVPSQRHLVQIRQMLGADSRFADPVESVAAVARRWNLAVQGANGPGPASGIAAAAQRFGLETAHFSGSLAHLLRFDLPVVLDLSVPGVNGRRFLALTGFDGKGFRYAPRLAEIDRLGLEDVEALWSGRAILLWKNHSGLRFVGQAGERGEAIRKIQGLLSRAGYYQGVPSGIFDGQTVAAVTRFQAESGLLQDGRIGPQTLILLYRAAGFFEASLDERDARKEGA